MENKLDIRFVSYDGKYPNLCSGKLILKIDGVNYTFGGYGHKGEDNCYDKFWESGGCAGVYRDTSASFCECGDWIVDKDELPNFLKDYADELCDIFNSHVQQGCCGGCI